MGEVLYEMAKMVFGDTLANELGDWTSEVFGVLDSTLGMLTASSLWKVCIIVACDLLVIYFFQSMMDQASRDMFSFDKLVVSFIKMLIAFSVLIYLEEILGYVIELGSLFNRLLIEDDGFIVSQSFSANAVDAYSEYFNHIYKILSILGTLFVLLIPYAIAFFAEIMGKFLILSSAIMLMVRCVFSPIAVVQLFEDGSRSSGMRYLKGLFADALSFAVIIVIIYVANTIGNSVINVSDPTWWTVPENILANFTFSDAILYIIPKLAVAGGMASGSKIAHDIVGA